MSEQTPPYPYYNGIIYNSQLFSSATGDYLPRSGVATSVATSTTFNGIVYTSGVTNTGTLSTTNLTVSGTVSLPSASIADSALSTNVALLSGTQTFSGTNTFTSVNASNLSVSGTLTAGTFNPSNISTGNLSVSGTLTAGTFNPSDISTGNLSISGTLTLPNNSISDSALSSNVAFLNGTQSFSGKNTFTDKCNFGASAFSGLDITTNSIFINNNLTMGISSSITSWGITDQATISANNLTVSGGTNTNGISDNATISTNSLIVNGSSSTNGITDTSTIAGVNISATGSMIISSNSSLINCPNQSVYCSGNVNIEGTINQSVNFATATGSPISSTLFVYYTSTNSPIPGFFVRPTTGVTGGDYQIVNTVDFTNHYLTLTGPTMTIPTSVVTVNGYINSSGALVVLSTTSLASNQIFTNPTKTNVSYIVSLPSSGVITAGKTFTATATAQSLSGYITNVSSNYYLITNTALPTTNNFISGTGVLPSSYVQGSVINGNSYQINSLTTITPTSAGTTITGFPISSTQISYSSYTGTNPTSDSGYFVGSAWSGGTTTANYGIIVSTAPSGNLIPVSTSISNYTPFTKTNTLGIVLSSTTFAVVSTTGFAVNNGLTATNSRASLTSAYISAINSTLNVITTPATLTVGTISSPYGYIKSGGTTLVLQSGQSIPSTNLVYYNNGTSVILPVQAPTLISGQDYTITGGTATTATTTVNVWFPTSTTLQSSYNFATNNLMFGGTGITDGATNTTTGTNPTISGGGFSATTARSTPPTTQYIFDGSNYYAYWAYSTVPQANDFVVQSSSAPQASVIELGTIINNSSSLVSYVTHPTTGTSRFSASTNQGINFYFLTSSSIILSTGSALGQINANPSTFGLTSTDICFFGGNYGTRPSTSTPVYYTFSYTANIVTVISFTNTPNFTPSPIYSTGTMASVSSSSTITYTTSGAKPLIGQFFNPSSGTYAPSGIVITAITGSASPYTITLSSTITQSAVAVSFTKSESSSVTGGFSMIASSSMLTTAFYPATTNISIYQPFLITTDTTNTFTSIVPQTLNLYAPSTYSTFTPTSYTFYNPSTTLTFYTYDNLTLPVPIGSTSDTLVSNTSSSTLSNKTFLNTIYNITIASFGLSSPYYNIYEVVSVSGSTITFPTPTTNITGLLLIFRRKSNATYSVAWSIGTGYSFVLYNTISGSSTTGTLLTTSQYSTSVFCDGTNWIQLVTQ